VRVKCRSKINFGILSSNKDITLKIGQNLVQDTTNIYAEQGTLTYDVSKDIIILAGKNTYEQESKSEYKTAGVSYGNNVVQINGSYGQDSSRTNSTSYENSKSIAKNININSQNATISGANIQATKDLKVNILNNLTLESLQDIYYSNSSGYNVGASVGIGISKDASNSAGANYSNNKSYTDIMWVNEQTSLTGGNSVDIFVGNKTTVKGAVISNSEIAYNEEGKIIFTNDKGNLKLITKEIEYSDIKDKNESETNSIKVGLNVGQGTDKQEATKYPKGSLSIGATASGYDKEQQTKATIGKGQIIVDGKEQTEQDLAGLNRAITNTQEITKDEITRALNIDTTIDLRLFSRAGQKDIINDIKNSPRNTKQMGKNIVKDIKQTSGVLSNVLDKIVETDRKKLKEMETKISKEMLKMTTDKKTKDNVLGTYIKNEIEQGNIKNITDTIKQALSSGIPKPPLR